MYFGMNRSIFLRKKYEWYEIQLGLMYVSSMYIYLSLDAMWPPLCAYDFGLPFALTNLFRKSLAATAVITITTMDVAATAAVQLGGMDVATGMSDGWQSPSVSWKYKSCYHGGSLQIGKHNFNIQHKCNLV